MNQPHPILGGEVEFLEDKSWWPRRHIFVKVDEDFRPLTIDDDKNGLYAFDIVLKAFTHGAMTPEAEKAWTARLQAPRRKDGELTAEQSATYDALLLEQVEVQVEVRVEEETSGRHVHRMAMRSIKDYPLCVSGKRFAIVVWEFPGRTGRSWIVFQGVSKQGFRPKLTTPASRTAS